MRKLVGAVAVLCLLGAAACGDDDGADVRSVEDDSGSGSDAASGSGSEASSGEPPVALDGAVEDHGTGAVEGDALDLELDDFYFGPTYVQAEPGATVALTLTNEGDASHTFTSDVLGVDEEVAGGENAEVEVTLPEQGATLFYCRFHQDRGMQGAFFSEPGDVVGDAGG